MSEIDLLTDVQACLIAEFGPGVDVGYDVGPARNLDCCECSLTQVWVGLLDTFNHSGDIRNRITTATPCDRPRGSLIEVKFAVCVPQQVDKPCGPDMGAAADSAAAIVEFSDKVERALQACGEANGCGNFLIGQKEYRAVEGGNCRIIRRQATFPLDC